MPLAASEIESMITDAFPEAEFTLESLIDDGDHYSLTIISEDFRGKSRVQQHQMVYDALQGKMGGVFLSQ